VKSVITTLDCFAHWAVCRVPRTMEMILTRPR